MVDSQSCAFGSIPTCVHLRKGTKGRVSGDEVAGWRRPLQSCMLSVGGEKRLVWFPLSGHICSGVRTGQYVLVGLRAAEGGVEVDRL